MDAFACDESRATQNGTFARKFLPCLLCLISSPLSNEWDKAGGTRELIFMKS